MSAHDERPRDETTAEREDRKFNDLLQELRVIQTSAQLTAGFLLTLPFQSRFEELSRGQLRLYLILVLLATVVMAVVLSPVAIHRHLSGRHVKGHVVAAAHVMARVALALLALLATGIVVFIFDVVTELSTALVVGIGLLAVFAVLMVAAPHYLVAKSEQENAKRHRSEGRARSSDRDQMPTDRG